MIDTISTELDQFHKENDAAHAELRVVIQSLLDGSIDAKTANAKLKEHKARMKPLDKRTNELLKLLKQSRR